MKYRKKPIVIEAIQWAGKNLADAMRLLGELGVDRNNAQLNFRGSLVIKTLEGEMEARRGDWIIRGVNGEVYPCKPDIFEKTYEAVSE